MKKIIILFALSVIMISCNKENENQFTITGSAAGIEDGNNVFLELQSETGTVKKDTVLVKDGKFSFTGEAEMPEIAFINVSDAYNYIPFILEKGDITIEFVKDSVQTSKVGGSKNNISFQSYNDKLNGIQKKMMAFQEKNMEKMQAAQQAQDQVTIQGLMDEFKVYQNEFDGVSTTFVKENNDSFLSVVLLENFILRKTLEISEIKSYFDKLEPSLKLTKNGKNISKMLDAVLKITIGKPAPEFAAPSPEGKTISLKESLGKVTLIDFWASWCGPCRQENPNVVALYNEFHEKGFNIIGVSLDDNADKWKEAITKDGLVWNHISNLKQWQEPIAEQYNVKSIPATFLLDEKGIIVATDLRGEELRKKVTEMLGSN